jgi:hypothetical protein
MVSAVCYLNTVTEGGETEFRIHERRIKPQEGYLLLFPSPWPSDHRAHPPRSGPKYIITTWLRFGDFPPL